MHQITFLNLPRTGSSRCGNTNNFVANDLWRFTKNLRWQGHVVTLELYYEMNLKVTTFSEIANIGTEWLLYWVTPENWKWFASLSCVTVFFFLTEYHLSYNDVKILYLCYVVNTAYKPIFMEHMHCCKESTTFMRDYLGM